MNESDRTYDLLIAGGTVIDGTGRDGIRADVAVDGDRIAAVGLLEGAAARNRIDATNMVVTPGFVDLHTHLDAQIAWDPYMTSSSWHGVTTALIGNCGVTFAPAATHERRYLAEMMESVEDIPHHAILESLPWDWKSYPEYLDSVQRMRPALNVVGLVGHCAIRYHVMGERALTDQPTATELAEMAEIAEDSVAGGAVGFSTSRITLHRVPDGRHVPGTFAQATELLALADGMNRGGGGLYQVVPNETRTRDEFNLLRLLAERAGDVVFSGTIGNDPERGPLIIERYRSFLEEVRTDGHVTALAHVRPSGALLGLHQHTPVRGPAWAEIMKLPTPRDRARALRSPEIRQRLVDDFARRGIKFGADRVHPLGTAITPNYLAPSLDELAQQAGVHPVEIVLDQLIESEGRALFCVWLFSAAHQHLADFLSLDGVIPGLADTGAHAGQICDADSTTYYLSHWSRDQCAVPLAEAIHRLTEKPAAVLGLADRGTIQTGSYADLNVFDPARLSYSYPEYSHDFPGGTGRFSVGSVGYAATIVNGEIVTEWGANTGARPGRVLREFRRD